MKIKVMDNLLKANDVIAQNNRALFEAHNVFVVNLMSSPGSGKTSLLEKTAGLLPEDVKLGVIEGDIETAEDAKRMEKAGIPVVQIQTGSACHLDANMIAGALEEFDLAPIDILVIENVGNLVCPAEFRVGEDHKAMILSVTEGAEKPLKYPLMFHESSLCVINKIDLAPYCDFDMEKARENARHSSPDLDIIELSCRTGEGLEKWVEWLLAKRNAYLSGVKPPPFAPPHGHGGKAHEHTHPHT